MSSQKDEFSEAIGAVLGIFWLCSWVICWVKMFQDFSAEHWGLSLVHAFGAFLIVPSIIAVWF